jgi:mono/diheme cytochrome c family protein
MRNAGKFFLIAWLLGAVLWSPGRVLAQYESGKGIYNDKCAICHGQDGKGNGPLAGSFSPSPADFTNPSFWQGNVNQRITDTIENGHGPMPAINLNSGEIRGVIDYMSHTFKP